MFSCKKYISLSYAERDRDLTKSERVWMDRHQKACESCRRFTQERFAALEILRGATLEPLADPNFDQRVIRHLRFEHENIVSAFLKSIRLTLRGKAATHPGTGIEQYIAEESLGVAYDVELGKYRVLQFADSGLLTVIKEIGPLGVHLLCSPLPLQNQIAVEELEDLINSSSTKERDLQRFFEAHPSLLVTSEYASIHPHVVFEKADGRELIPDFILKPSDPQQLCDILDLKSPHDNLVVKASNPDRTRFSAKVFEAMAQLKDYQRYLDSKEHRDTLLRGWGLALFRPRLHIVLGRTIGLDAMQLAIAKDNSLGSQADWHVLSYDQVLARAKSSLQKGDF